MKLTNLLNVFLCVFLLCGITASAEVINFDDLTDNGSGTPITGVYHGLTWSNFYVLNTTLYPINPSGYQNGTVSAPNVAYNGFGDAAMTMGSVFDFNSAYFTAAWNDGLDITIVGKLGGVTEDTTTFTVDTSGPTLETFNWTNIDELDFSSAGGVNHGYSGAGTQFALDDMTINGTTVPEPHLLLFLIVGLACMVGVQRWRLAKNV
jgi:hypothetical protein